MSVRRGDHDGSSISNRGSPNPTRAPGAASSLVKSPEWPARRGSSTCPTPMKPRRSASDTERGKVCGVTAAAGCSAQKCPASGAFTTTGAAPGARGVAAGALMRAPPSPETTMRICPSGREISRPSTPAAVSASVRNAMVAGSLKSMALMPLSSAASAIARDSGYRSHRARMHGPRTGRAGRGYWWRCLRSRCRQAPRTFWPSLSPASVRGRSAWRSASRNRVRPCSRDEYAYRPGCPAPAAKRDA
ncbi:hypothetical protein RHECNPAF_1360086 [Rhizobium etli CNPAF512]|nr:hypothetical protein RHECNPAF_1360086 [Rhizobium etli CNPAF512]